MREGAARCARSASVPNPSRRLRGPSTRHSAIRSQIRRAANGSISATANSRPGSFGLYFPSLAVWASLWSDRPDDQIRFAIEDQRLTWTLMGEATDEDEERPDQLRYRLDVMINADLRISFGN